MRVDHKETREQRSTENLFRSPADFLEIIKNWLIAIKDTVSAILDEKYSGDSLAPCKDPSDCAIARPFISFISFASSTTIYTEQIYSMLLIGIKEN